jgi:hypothetical protein
MVIAAPEQRPMTFPSTGDLPAIAQGTLRLYRCYDIGYSIDLERAAAVLRNPAERRRSPVRVRQTRSVQVAQAPLIVELGQEPVDLAGLSTTGRLRATVYELGAVAVALDLPLSAPVTWERTAELMALAQDPPLTLLGRFDDTLEELRRLLGPAVSRPERAAEVEDYSVLVIQRLDGDPDLDSLLAHPRVQSAFLGERRPLSPHATGLITRLSYYPDDAALLSWNGAMLIDPDPRAADTAADLLEFANVQLLLLRTYDAEVDRGVDGIESRLARLRNGRRLFHFGVRRYTRLMHEVQGLVAEVNTVTDGLDNAIKFTDDVYWNRLYSAMLEVLSVRSWRRALDTKLGLLRETYAMLHDQADAERAATLEWTIIVLIVLEIVLALKGA